MKKPIYYCQEPTFAQQMNYHRTKNNLTFAWLESVTLIKESRLCQIEGGKEKNITLNTADKIIRAFGLTNDEYYKKKEEN